MLSARTSHLRVRHGQEHYRVTFVELFFDLVFVFAVTQLSHGPLKHLTPLDALQTGLLMIAVWWAWIDTAWITNWLDPRRPAVRLLLFALMLAGLVMSSSIPRAFEDRGLSLALAYVTTAVRAESTAVAPGRTGLAGGFGDGSRICDAVDALGRHDRRADHRGGVGMAVTAQQRALV